MDKDKRELAKQALVGVQHAAEKGLKSLAEAGNTEEVAAARSTLQTALNHVTAELGHFGWMEQHDTQVA